MVHFMIPSSLITKLGRNHFKNKNSCVKRFGYEDDLVKMSKKKHGSTPNMSIDLFVGKDEKKYPIPLEYFAHPRLQELIKEYQEHVFDPRFDEPIVVEWPTETFEQLLHYIIKNS